jgi:hypothetical protein
MPDWIDRDACLRAATDLYCHAGYDGAFGLMAFAHAAVSGAGLTALATRAPLLAPNALPALTTMEIAWVLIGALHAREAHREPLALSLASAALAELSSRRWASSGLMAHAGPDAPLRSRARAKVANFADQIYALQAFALAGHALEDEAALASGRRLAAALVARQGERGEWFWHYEPSTGRILSRYPVYAVHQYGMAPMAFACLARAGGPDHSAAVARGFAWIHSNEAGVSMLDEAAGTTWRDIDRDETRLSKSLRKAVLLVGALRRDDGPARSVRINHETRPYEWGWGLYAAALARGPMRGHLL